MVWPRSGSRAEKLRRRWAKRRWLPPQATPFLLGQRQHRLFRASDESATFDVYVFGGALSNAGSTLAHMEPRKQQVEKFQKRVGEPLTMPGLAPVRIGDFYLEARGLLVGPFQKTGF